jgi:hypothetical protein
VDNHQNPAQRIHTQRDEALLALGIRILDGESHRIAQRLLGMCEADLVLLEIGLRLGWIELDAHCHIMHTACIFATAAPTSRLLGCLTFELRGKQRQAPHGAE